ncbi:SDR family oxidoreductase [Chryseobacterium profundimaris]|uniref:NADP-dependent 3-hydroxy acid dehydrogenase YdfG n=1 Tax=Chryseobacterium profundimaris TaxID=1387275 RepID=A0ABY1NY65_9FLAO|nr:SDR family oxidoreductase [Chryseobacterium profundimaris]SMP21856.1 NADP-dependent 3-hydroxy acid dehydrogenase YdfG [Chryseobacterium profundimaris]
MENINGKVVAITGASSGMGKAIAIGLAKNGAKVVLGARRTENLLQLVEEIKSTGGEAACTTIDVKNRADLDLLVQTAVDHYGKLDVMVNNAGISQLGRIDDLDLEDWEEMIDINLKGVLYGMAAAIRIFKKQKEGHIINIISTAGLKITPMMGVYAGTKNAVRTVSEAFRQESDGNIRISGISPGFVKTDFAENIKNKEMKTAIQQGMEEIAISPAAIANAVIYVVSQPKDVEIGELILRPSRQN